MSTAHASRAIESYQTFELGVSLTADQKEFYQKHGFCHFKGVFSQEAIARAKASILAATEENIKNGIETKNGVPIKYGFTSSDKLIAQRTPFMNLMSAEIDSLVRDEKLKPLLEFIPKSRFGLNERDGVVVNRYSGAKKSRYKKLGWHTDSIRDLFYFEKVRPMLNVGIHLSPSSEGAGGLRILPGTHEQGLFGLLFHKFYLFDSKKDPEEVVVTAEPGDVTIHDGRMWHRAETPSQELGYERFSMYFPIICGPYHPKTENSPAPFYLRFMSRVQVRDYAKS